MNSDFFVVEICEVCSLRISFIRIIIIFNDSFNEFSVIRSDVVKVIEREVKVVVRISCSMVNWIVVCNECVSIWRFEFI